MLVFHKDLVKMVQSPRDAACLKGMEKRGLRKISGALAERR